MVMERDRNGLEVLDPDECVRLLRTRSVGRIGISSRALPTILPVDYVVADGRVLFRTGAGTKLDAASRGVVVAFEVDDVDDAAGTAWSVVITGVAATCGTEAAGRADEAATAAVGAAGRRNMRIRAERRGGSLVVEGAPSGPGTALRWSAPLTR